MLIQTGASAPLFTALDHSGNRIATEDFKGKWLLLSFLRNGACAICNLHVRKLIQQFPKLQSQGLEIITVFESPLASIQQYVGTQDAPFSIIPDPDAELYALYGVESSAEKTQATMSKPETPAVIAEAAAQGFALTPEEGSNFHRMPAEFLIRPNGTVEIAHYANYVYDHLEFDVLEKAISL